MKTDEMDNRFTTPTGASTHLVGLVRPGD